MISPRLPSMYSTPWLPAHTPSPLYKILNSSIKVATEFFLHHSRCWGFVCISFLPKYSIVQSLSKYCLIGSSDLLEILSFHASKTILMFIVTPKSNKTLLSQCESLSPPANQLSTSVPLQARAWRDTPFDTNGSTVSGTFELWRVNIELAYLIKGVKSLLAGQPSWQLTWS